jgi:hypothetical protein
MELCNEGNIFQRLLDVTKGFCGSFEKGADSQLRCVRAALRRQKTLSESVTQFSCTNDASTVLEVGHGWWPEANPVNKSPLLFTQQNLTVSRWTNLS